MSVDPWAGYKSMLAGGINRAASEIALSHGVLVREQLSAGINGPEAVPALVCLRAAAASGGNAEQALPAAVALALLAEMAVVFVSLESQNGSASLSTAWGMPRGLNAGDAFFAAAQASLLDKSLELPAARRLHALEVLDDATLAFLDALHVAADSEQQITEAVRALLPASLVLAGIYTGCSDATMNKLAALGKSWLGLESRALELALAADLRGAFA